MKNGCERDLGIRGSVCRILMGGGRPGYLGREKSDQRISLTGKKRERDARGYTTTEARKPQDTWGNAGRKGKGRVRDGAGWGFVSLLFHKVKEKSRYRKEDCKGR